MVTEVSAAANVTSNAVKKLNDGLQDNLDKTNDNEPDSSLSYVNSLLLPILASLNEQTGNLLAPVNIDINNKNILDTLLILIKNIIIVFQMYLIVSSKLDPDMFPNSKYDPFIISQLSNNFQYLYDKINQTLNNNNNSSLESTSKDIISKNKDAISMLVLLLALHIGVEPRLFGGSNNKKTKQNKRTKKNTKQNKKTKKNKQTKQNKQTKKKLIKMKAKRQTHKSKI